MIKHVKGAEFWTLTGFNFNLPDITGCTALAVQPDGLDNQTRVLKKRPNFAF